MIEELGVGQILSTVMGVNRGNLRSLQSSFTEPLQFLLWVLGTKNLSCNLGHGYPALGRPGQETKFDSRTQFCGIWTTIVLSADEFRGFLVRAVLSRVLF